eukprot:Skav231656  [mRNA]  locus=scaffold4949:9286:17847:+ [translate_table: standard]
MAAPSLGEVHRRLPKPEEFKNLVRYKGPSSSQVVLKQAATNSELQKAVETGDVNMARGILRYGAAKRCVNVNAPLFPKRERLLHLAARKGFREMCLLLLEANAEIDAEEISDGKQPLHEACCQGHLDVCELLLDRKARIEEANFTGLRPLHWAACSGHVEICDMLLDRRAVLHSASGDTWQPIHHAAANGHEEVVRLFCRRGAKADAETGSGQKAFDLACLGDHKKAVMTLLDFGALFSMEDFSSEGTLRRCQGSEIEDVVREVGQLRFQLDEAEEMADMGQTEDAAALFGQISRSFSLLGLHQIDVGSSGKPCMQCVHPHLDVTLGREEDNECLILGESKTCTFCTSRGKQCLNIKEYMCTTDPSQCSTELCRCEDASHIRKALNSGAEMQTVNRSTCYLCTPSLPECPVSPSPCSQEPCECKPGFAKVRQRSDELCFSCQPSMAQSVTGLTSFLTFLSAGATFLLCVGLGVVVGCAIRRFIVGDPVPAARRKRKNGSQPRTGNSLVLGELSCSPFFRAKELPGVAQLNGDRDKVQHVMNVNIDKAKKLLGGQARPHRVRGTNWTNLEIQFCDAVPVFHEAESGKPFPQSVCQRLLVQSSEFFFHLRVAKSKKDSRESRGQGLSLPPGPNA